MKKEQMETNFPCQIAKKCSKGNENTYSFPSSSTEMFIGISLRYSKMLLEVTEFPPSDIDGHMVTDGILAFSYTLLKDWPEFSESKFSNASIKI